MLIRRQENEGKIHNFTSLFKELTFVELIDVDKVAAKCTGIQSHCIIKRTKEKLPEMIEGSSGPIIRLVISLDASRRLDQTYIHQYISIRNSTNFKYNKAHYYWYADGYLYIPDVDWDAIRVEALFDDDITFFNCPDDGSPCDLAQNRDMPIPEYLFAEIEQMVLQELLTTGKIPSDGADDSQNVLR